jgi:hypothetical protein
MLSRFSQSNGNLAIIDAAGRPVWETDTARRSCMVAGTSNVGSRSNGDVVGWLVGSCHWLAIGIYILAFASCAGV